MHLSILNRLKTILPRMTDYFSDSVEVNLTYTGNNIIIPVGSQVGDYLNVSDIKVRCIIQSATKKMWTDNTTYCYELLFDTKLPFIFDSKIDDFRYITFTNGTLSYRYEVLDIDQFNKKLYIKTPSVPDNFIGYWYEGTAHHAVGIYKRDVDFTVSGTNAVVPFPTFDNYTYMKATIITKSYIHFWARDLVKDRKQLTVDNRTLTTDKCVLFVTPDSKTFLPSQTQQGAGGRPSFNEHSVGELRYYTDFIIELMVYGDLGSQDKTKMYAMLTQCSDFVLRALTGYVPETEPLEDTSGVIVDPCVCEDIITAQKGDNGNLVMVMKFGYAMKYQGQYAYKDMSLLSNFNALSYNQKDYATLVDSDFGDFEINYKEYLSSLNNA